MMLPRKRVFLKASLRASLSTALALMATRSINGYSQATRSSATPRPGLTVVKILRPPEDIVREKRWAFLIKALDRTIERYGPYVLQTVLPPMSTQREVREVIAGDVLNVIASDCGHPDLNASAIPVPIPIDRGLLGYRVALIRKEAQPRISAVNDLDGLRRLTIGQGQYWGDVPIYQFNNIPLITNSNYSLLFAMLSNGRFDLFPRGIVEIIPELHKFQLLYPNLDIDNHLLIKYPYAEFFYVSRNSRFNGATDLRTGSKSCSATASSTYSSMNGSRTRLATCISNERSIITLESPPLPAWVPTGRPQLWLDPLVVH